MIEDKENPSNMLAELFIKPIQDMEFLLPPKSKADYIKDLNSLCKSEERLVALSCLVNIYHFNGIGRGGHYYYSEEDCNELIALLQKLGKDNHLRLNVAIIAFEEGGYCEKIRDYDKAVQFYKLSLNFETDYPLYRYFQYNNLAFCFNYFERFSEAEELLRKAIAIVPEIYNAWKNIGVSLEHQGKYEEAAGCYLKAINLSDGEHRSRWHLDRLIRRHPSLKVIPAIKEWGAQSGHYKNLQAV